MTQKMTHQEFVKKDLKKSFLRNSSKIKTMSLLIKKSRGAQNKINQTKYESSSRWETMIIMKSRIAKLNRSNGKMLSNRKRNSNSTWMKKCADIDRVRKTCSAMRRRTISVCCHMTSVQRLHHWQLFKFNSDRQLDRKNQFTLSQKTSSHLNNWKRQYVILP